MCNSGLRTLAYGTANCAAGERRGHLVRVARAGRPGAQERRRPNRAARRQQTRRFAASCLSLSSLLFTSLHFSSLLFSSLLFSSLLFSSLLFSSLLITSRYLLLRLRLLPIARLRRVRVPVLALICYANSNSTVQCQNICNATVSVYEILVYKLRVVYDRTSTYVVL